MTDPVLEFLAWLALAGISIFAVWWIRSWIRWALRKKD